MAFTLLPPPSRFPRWLASLGLPLIMLLGACSHGSGLASPTLALRLLFDEGSPALRAGFGPEIDDLASSVAEDEDRYVILASFAGDPSDNADRMLALSLARVLLVRARLLTAGVSTKRIIVRACGVRDTQEPRERVDVFLAEPTERSPSFCGPKPVVPLPLGPDEETTLSI